jgi:hypothetical protein
LIEIANKLTLGMARVKHIKRMFWHVCPLIYRTFLANLLKVGLSFIFLNASLKSAWQPQDECDSGVDSKKGSHVNQHLQEEASRGCRWKVCQSWQRQSDENWARIHVEMLLPI